MTTSSKDTVFDVEQLLFARLREGMSKLGSDIMTKMTRCNTHAVRSVHRTARLRAARSELHRWLALPLYSSTFRLCPAQRTDSLAPVNLYDEATKVVASTGVNYVVRPGPRRTERAGLTCVQVSTCAESHFVSVRCSLPHPHRSLPKPGPRRNLHIGRNPE